MDIDCFVEYICFPAIFKWYFYFIMTPDTIAEFHQHCQTGFAVIGFTFLLLTIYSRYLRLKLRELTSRIELLKADLANSRSERNALLKSIKSLVLEIDRHGKITKILPSNYKAEFYISENMLNKNIQEFFGLDFGKSTLDLIEKILEDKTTIYTEFFFKGKSIHFECTLTPLKSLSVLMVATDVTHIRKKRKQLRYRAYYDALTGLPNKTLLMDRLAHAIEKIHRDRRKKFFVLFIDLDRFRIINETLGISIGDRVLQAMARRFSIHLRKVDTVARYGRDEFIILLDDLEKDHDAFVVVDRIQTDLLNPFHINCHEIFLSASIGIVKVTSDYKNAGNIIRDAESAMHRAKINGAGYLVYDRGMHEYAAKFLNLETDLRNALQRNEFILYYQPIIDLKTRNIMGLEALIRWRHPVKGLIGPADFIPIAEQTGLIVSIGKWVIKEACRNLAAYMKLYPIKPPFTVAINISAKQFIHADLIETVREAINDTGVDPRCLKFEITETQMMNDAEMAFSTLKKLKDMGIGLAVDDFGTGYSSLSYLHKYPFDTLKIDRSFVNKIGSARHNKHLKIIQSIMSLALHLNMDVIAEGIEGTEQLDQLKDLNCQCGQGFYFSRPLNPDKLKELFEKYYSKCFN